MKLHSSHTPTLGYGGGGGEGGGRGAEPFSERSYRRDLGQIRILGGNWHFSWGDIF